MQGGRRGGSHIIRSYQSLSYHPYLCQNAPRRRQRILGNDATLPTIVRQMTQMEVYMLFFLAQTSRQTNADPISFVFIGLFVVAVLGLMAYAIISQRRARQAVRTQAEAAGWSLTVTEPQALPSGNIMRGRMMYAYAGRKDYVSWRYEVIEVRQRSTSRVTSGNTSGSSTTTSFQSKFVFDNVHLPSDGILILTPRLPPGDGGLGGSILSLANKGIEMVEGQNIGVAVSTARNAFDEVSIKNYTDYGLQLIADDPFKYYAVYATPDVNPREIFTPQVMAWFEREAAEFDAAQQNRDSKNTRVANMRSIVYLPEGLFITQGVEHTDFAKLQHLLERGTELADALQRRA
jgi:hypothetical protein